MTTTTVPLSTVFSAPASCSTSWTYEASTYNNIASGIFLQNAVTNFWDNKCFPPGFAQFGRTFGHQIFSPGACPEGYVTQSPSFLNVNGGTTTATCCSQGFSYTTDSSGLQGCLGYYSGASSLAARAGGFGQTEGTTSTSLSGSYTMWGVPITVQFQADELSLYTTTTSSVPSTTSSVPSTTSSVPSTTSGVPSTPSISPTTSLVSQPTGPSPAQKSSSHPPSSKQLSTGAKAGITVGVVIGVLILLGIATLGWRRKRGTGGKATGGNNKGRHELHESFLNRNMSQHQSTAIEMGTGEPKRHAELAADGD